MEPPTRRDGGISRASEGFRRGKRTMHVHLQACDSVENIWWSSAGRRREALHDRVIRSWEFDLSRPDPFLARLRRAFPRHSQVSTNMFTDTL